MEVSTHSNDSLVKKIIPEYASGILFSNIFDQMHEMFNKTKDTSYLDTLDKRIEYLQNLSSAETRKIFGGYIFMNENVPLNKSTVFIRNEDKSIIVFLENLYEAFNTDEFCYPADPIYFWKTVIGHRKITLRKTMQAILSVIYRHLFNNNDCLWLNEEADMACDNEEDYDKEWSYAAKEYIRRDLLLNSMIKEARTYDLDSLLKKLKKYDRKAFDIINEHIEDVYYIASEKFNFWHFISLENEYNNGEVDVNSLFFCLTDEYDSFWDIVGNQQNYECASQSGVSNYCSSIKMIEDSLDLSKTKESIKKDCECFASVREMFNKITNHICS